MPVHAMLLAGVFVFLFAASPYAAGEREEARGESPRKAFEALDTNKDGWITRPEVAAHPEIAPRFKDADRDGDRRLSRAEYRALSGGSATAATGAGARDR